MITEYLFLTPSGEILCDVKEIRRYVERHYGNRYLCSQCGCYLVPTGRTRRLLLHEYRCVNSICPASLWAFRLWPPRRRGAA